MHPDLIARCVLNYFLICALWLHGTPEPDDDPMVVTTLRRLYATVLYGFIEFGLHYLAHTPRLRAATGHDKHHADPDDLSTALVREDVYAVLATTLVAASWLGLLYTPSAVLIVVWYSCYEALHLLQHLNPAMVPYAAVMWHREDHHKEPTTRFGVSTCGWDRLLLGDGKVEDFPRDFLPVVGWY